MQPHLFCFGLGYTALSFARTVLEQGWRVSGTCRSAEKCQSLQQLGITAEIFDEGLPLLYPATSLEGVTHILHSIPPSAEGDSVLKEHLSDLTSLESLQWMGYFSTTGVYGDTGGEWVEETSPAHPANERSNWRVEAEAAWRASGLPVQVFRLAGIYGAGRSALDQLKNGTARRIEKKGQVFSRIHVEDIVRIVGASMQKPRPGEIYNCADDLPAPQEEVVAYAASLLHMEPPSLVPFEKAELTPMARSFYGSCRRVRNNKIKQQLGVTLLYPDYKSGLKSLAEA